MKIIQFILLLIFTGINAQKKDAGNLFESYPVARKVNNVLSFIDKSSTILLNNYNESVIYVLITPIHEKYFVASIKNELPKENKEKFKCFQINDNRFLAFMDRSDENFGQDESYKENFAVAIENLTSCNTLFKKLKENKLPKIPVNVFAYSIFEENFIYLEDLATFDALQYLEIEYNLNRSK